MSFVSPEFAIFFAIVVPLYFAIPYRLRWIYLLVASYFFYAYWNTSFIILIAFSTLVDFFVGKWIYETDPENTRRRNLLLAASMFTNLGILFTFKYFNFFNNSFADLLHALNITYSPAALNVILPVGISFYTFQSMSYTIDIYRGKLTPEKNFGVFATFVAFFPQLVAGPIERAENMLPQFKRMVDFNYERIVDGLRLILWGAFKKVVIADRVAVYVNGVYNNLDGYSGLPLIVATFFFAFQIYCDFSGYSDIAIGTAKIMGFDLMDNFKQPYLANSARDFWRRWHISLSTWFRDYLYIPLGGNRVTFARILVNLMIVFVVSGLWHGANWTFVMWGALHGGYLVIETLLARYTRISLPRILQITITFVIVCFAWIFFRANTIADAGYVVAHLFDFSSGTEGISQPFEGSLLGAQISLIVSVFLIVALMLIEWIDLDKGLMATLKQQRVYVRWAIYYLLAIFVLLSYLISIYLNTNTQQFIYFQF